MKIVSICNISLMIVLTFWATKIGFDEEAAEWKYVWYFFCFHWR